MILCIYALSIVLFLLSFLMLFASSLLLVNLAQSLSILLIFLRNQNCFTDFSIFFFQAYISFTSVLQMNMYAYSFVSDSLKPHGLQPTRILFIWNFPSKNTGVDCHFLLQEIFLPLGSNPCLLHLLNCQVDSLLQSHMGNPRTKCTMKEIYMTHQDRATGE